MLQVRAVLWDVITFATLVLYFSTFVAVTAVRSSRRVQSCHSYNLIGLPLGSVKPSLLTKEMFELDNSLNHEFKLGRGSARYLILMVFLKRNVVVPMGEVATPMGRCVLCQQP